MRIDASVPANEMEEKINALHSVYRVQVGHKIVDRETIYRLIDIRGNDTLGYIASSEEWFTAIDKFQPEFYEVEFQTSIHRTVDSALLDAIPDAFQEAEEAGFWLDIALRDGIEIAFASRQKPVGEMVAEVEPVIETIAQAPLNPADYEYTDGYVGGLGIVHDYPNQEKLNELIGLAAEYNTMSRDKIEEMLRNGTKVVWGISPNHTYDHSLAYLRKRSNKPEVDLILCACGHSVPWSQMMNASLGTSCPDCYDKMSG